MLRNLMAMHAVAASVAAACAASLVVVGDDGGHPVAGATLLSESGYIIGFTDNAGAVSLSDGRMYPVSVRSLGFEVATLEAPTDTLVMKSVAYELPEVAVTAGDRPIRRIVCYAREYSTGTTGLDTMQLYSEYMFESFVADGKVKGYHSSDANLNKRAVRRYALLSGRQQPDSVFMPKEQDDITLLALGEMFCRLPEKGITETVAIRGGADTDSLAGKYGTRKIFTKHDDRYTVVTDVLSDHKDHSWTPGITKLLGMTFDISQFKITECFQENDKGTYSRNDMLYSSMNLDILGRGKVFKWVFHSDEPVKMGTYVEFYPVAVTVHTPEEYKEMRKDRSPLDFILPDCVLPEIPAAARLKQRAGK